MSTKDWILLLVPIVFNGVVVFVLQKLFERKQLALSEKYKYVATMQKKVDNALSLFMKVLQTTGDDLVQISWLNDFASSYCDVFYYYQQNQELFKSLENYMSELLNEHNQINEIHTMTQNSDLKLEDRQSMESHFRRIYELLQSIQNACIQHRI